MTATDDTAPAMIWTTDAEGTCTYLSDTWYAFTGQTPETALGTGWLDAAHPEDRDRAAQALGTANAGREPFRVDVRLRGRDGEYRAAIGSGTPRFGDDGAFGGFIGAVVDVSDRARSVEALRESEARLRAVFSSIDEGFCLCEMVVDDEGRPIDYRFLEANPLFASMTGLDDPEGHTARELVPGLEQHWIETYGRVALEHIPLRFEQGSEAMGRWFDVFATPVEPHGRFALVFTDVTRRRRADLERREREEAERQARRQAELLEEIVIDLEGVESFDGRLQRLVELLVPRLADVAAVDLPDRMVGAPSGEAAAALLTATPDPAAGPRRATVALEIGADLAVPLLLARDHPDREPFGDADLAFLRRVAERVSLVLARGRVREQEHRIALRLQQALLPDRIVRRPELDIAARYVAASDVLEVGGDWYDTFALSERRVGLVVGDVVGHGLDAAATMGRLRTALAALAPHADGPGRLLSYLDEFAVGPNRADFATAVCATLDTSTGMLHHASAGHPPMLVVSRTGEARWLEGARSGPLFGQVIGDRPEASDQLEPGDLLVAFSDGLVERRAEQIDRGFERLERSVVAGRELPVEELADRIVTELGVATERTDDVVVVCLRLTTIPTSRFRRVLSARPAELGPLRHGVRAWMDARGIEDPVRADVLLALGEAASNAIEHGYPDGMWGDIEIEIAEGEHDLLIQVRDDGVWRAGARDDDRGRGTTIMRAIADDFARRTGPDGTTVTLRLARG